MAVQRAEDKTAQMQARSGAIDELIASGALDDASSLNKGDDIARELESMSSQLGRRVGAGGTQGGYDGHTPARGQVGRGRRPRPRSRRAR